MHRSAVPGDALEELLDTQHRNPSVSEINILAHSKGNWITLEALRSRYIRPARVNDKVKNVMLVAPDVGVDVFRTQISRMGSQRPRFGVPADGEIDVAALVIDGVKRTEPPLMLPPPLLIAMKDQVWHSVSNAISH